VRLASDSIDLSGDIDLPLARLMLSQVPVSAVAPSDDIIYVDSVKVRDRPVSAELRITLGDSVSFSGFNFNAELGGSIQLTQVPGRMPTASGTLLIEEGFYKAYGQDLKIKDGAIRFSGGPVNNPVIALQATRVLAGTGASDSVIAGIDIRGNLKDPQVSLFSQPPMSQTQILSYILTGSPVGGGTGAEGNFFNKALSSLGLKGGNLLARSVGHQLGLAEATLQTESDVKHTSLRIGRFLTPSLYVSYGMGLFDPVSTLRLRYVLSNHITLMAEAGQVTSGDALIKLEPGKKKEP
jgi:translocation and assembly module TamB